MKIIRKPIELEAYEIYDGEETRETPKWLIDAMIGGKVILVDKDKKVTIETNHGAVQADVGDYIIRGMNGELYPCSKEMFSKLYDKL